MCMKTKTCIKCGIKKSLLKFDRHQTTKDKRQSWCRTCKNDYRRERRRLKIGCNANEYENYRKQHLITCRRRNTSYRQVVIEHYSPNVCCSKCGFNDIRALSIDHINGNGALHRKELGNKNIYQWLVENNFPSNFQILCMNCQFIKRHKENKYQTHIPEKLTPYTKVNEKGIKQIFFAHA